VIIAGFFRYSSVASLVAAALAPFYQLLIWGGGPVAVAIGVMSLLLVWRHWLNIQRLLDGTESRLGRRAPEAAPPATARHRGRKPGHKKGARP
jgi:glycerol-3-phosphate acyltransferase PlsY